MISRSYKLKRYKKFPKRYKKFPKRYKKFPKRYKKNLDSENILCYTNKK